MFPPFPQEIALHYLRVLSSSLDSGESVLRQIARESEERRGQGVMIGCLVCTEALRKVPDSAEPTSVPAVYNRRVLFAVSGIAKELVTGGTLSASFDVTGTVTYTVVPPIVSPEKIESALAENDAKIHELTEKINSITEEKLRSALRKERTALTTQSLAKVFDLYNFTRFDGAQISLNEIIMHKGGRLPPTGTGDCCAPKLLSYAFAHGLVPVSMAEMYYCSAVEAGMEHTGTGMNRAPRLTKRPGTLYPPCDERCGFILPYILGVGILYRDRDIIVINKPAGLLSVPGRGEDKQDCAESRVCALFPPYIGEGSCLLKQSAVHRLDMETSGILIMALNKHAHAALEKQFEQGLVHKKYIALLDGILHGKPEGRTELKFRLDTENRPYQIYDEKNGKLGVTQWHKIKVEIFINPLTGEKKKVTRVEFIPLTGRTHQLRLASADSHGLGLAIVGDSLYGQKKEGERLMLHSCEIEFEHPSSHKKMKIAVASDF